MVSEWMEYGNLTSYVTKHPDADRIGICVDICAGLSYIHEKDMVHGDLKGANVMISSAGKALIADFGNVHFRELTLKFTGTTKSGFSLRLVAPELFAEEINKPNKESDIYSYGMETFTGKVPFEGKSELSVIRLLTSESSNLSPVRPEDYVSDEVLEILTMCWERDPTQRPAVREIWKKLRAVQMGSNEDSLDIADADMRLVRQHHKAFKWAEVEAEGKLNARYISNGFPTWINWDLFARLENQERGKNNQAPLPDVTSTTPPEQLEDIYDEWCATRDKWLDRFWDPSWAHFMRDQGGPIQGEQVAEPQTSCGEALEAARIYPRKNLELPLAKHKFARGYLWDQGYMHPDWRCIKRKPWKWTVEHENDERRALGRVPLPRYHSGMSAGDWKDVRDVWHTTASMWAEKRKYQGWLEHDRREGITPEERGRLGWQFFDSRGHRVTHKAFSQPIEAYGLSDGSDQYKSSSTEADLTLIHAP